MQMWIAECLEFDIFFKTIGMMRMIPQRTLQGMLAMLPYNKHAPVSQKINPTIRKALTITLQTINRCQNNHTAFFTLAVAMALFSLAMMIILWSWKPLAGFFFVMPVIGLEKWLARSGLQQWKHRISAIRKDQGWDAPNFIDIAAQLDWGVIDIHKKERLLGFLTNRDIKES